MDTQAHTTEEVEQQGWLLDAPTLSETGTNIGAEGEHNDTEPEKVTQKATVTAEESVDAQAHTTEEVEQQGWLLDAPTLSETGTNIGAEGEHNDLSAQTPVSLPSSNVISGATVTESTSVSTVPNSTPFADHEGFGISLDDEVGFTGSVENEHTQSDAVPFGVNDSFGAIQGSEDEHELEIDTKE